MGNLFGQRRVGLVRQLAFVAMSATVLQLMLAGYRWQMLPAYAAAPVIFFAAARPPANVQGSFVRSVLIRSLAVIGLLPLLLSLLLTWAFPVFRLPAPTGGFGIGTDEFVAVDHARSDVYGDDESPRELVIRVWYPSLSTSELTHPVSCFRYPEIRSRAVTANNPLPSFTFQHLGNIPTHSYWQAAPARRGRHPDRGDPRRSAAV